MPKVRVEIVPDFGPRKGHVEAGIVVEPDHDSLLVAVQNKLKIKKKDASKVTLYSHDFTGLRLLPKGDLREHLHNGAKVMVCMGELSEELLLNASEGQQKYSKRSLKAVEQLKLVKAGCGSLSARGRPSLEALAALQACKNVTGVVTLLRQDECQGGAAHIGQACDRLGLKWCHAPLFGPKEMGMIGSGKACLTAEDVYSFRKVRQVKEWLQSSEENLVVHCAAGLHRTGIFLYIILRELGHLPEDAIVKIQEMRQETFDEFTRLNLQRKAEAIFKLVSSGFVVSSEEVSSVVEVVADRARDADAEVESEHDDDCDG